MKMLTKLIFSTLAVASIAGCATGTDGVVPIGPDTYMVGGYGKFTDFSGSAAKARFFQQANKFCADQGRVMVPIGSTGQDSGIGTYASAEVQFRCLLRDDPRLAK